MSSKYLVISTVDDVVIATEYITIDPLTVENLSVPSLLQIPTKYPSTKSFVPPDDDSDFGISPTNADLVQQSRLELVVFLEVSDADPDLLFVHPQETEDAKIARIQET